MRSFLHGSRTSNCMRSCCVSEYSSEFGECWPLDPVTQSVLKKNFRELVDLLDVDGDLIDEMSKRGCFSFRSLRSLEDIPDPSTRNKRLIEMLMRTSATTFRLFTDSLSAVQTHLVPMLTGNTGKEVTMNNLLLP
jgi:hypothetical protein